MNRFYRWWRALNHQGLVENTFEGYDKHKRAQAIGLLVAVAPSLTLMVSDIIGLDRGWLWYGWSAVAITWGIGVLAIIFFQTGKSAVRYYREWKSGRR